VKSDLAELLSAVKVGNPAEEETRMGPLATSSQLADALDGLSGLLSEGRLVHGKNERFGTRGFFLSPVLVEAAPDARKVHEHEVFGPVATLIPYSDSPERIVARGQGGLVCSVYSDDQAFIDATVMEIAPYHGRIFLGHPKIELSPGPGTVLPQLAHGGPGRAGGGEELGGPRGLAFYLQRVALEGSRPVIQKITGAKA
jgi:oxepin-CoA hydrolase/3-oxo-5,6-dehydrosuberyl-CoA semialdehyde dehydrogenase